MCAYYDWYDTAIQVDFIRLDNNVHIHVCKIRYAALDHQRVNLIWCHYNVHIYSQTIFNSHPVCFGI